MKTNRREVVVVTGASAGVGRAVALEFARRGARLGLVARGRERLEAARRDVEQHGGEAVILAGDVADPVTHEQIARMTEDAFGPLDVWVNNAMASVYSTVAEMPEEEFKRVTEVTFLGYVYGTKAALRRMLPRNRGTIVQVGSALAYRSIPQQSAYCAAKHAIHGFTDSLRSELLAAGSAVRLTMVQLPSMNTPQFVWVKSRLAHAAKPPAPIYAPAVAARMIHWAAHHPRREVYVGLTTSLGIKLNKLWPALLDRYLVGRAFGQTHRPHDPRQPDNLWSPAPGDWAADGPFTGEATPRAWQPQVSRHRAGVLAATATVGAGLALLWLAKRRHAAGASSGGPTPPRPQSPRRPRRVASAGYELGPTGGFTPVGATGTERARAAMRGAGRAR